MSRIFDIKASIWHQRVNDSFGRYKEEDARNGNKHAVTQTELVKRLQNKYPQEDRYVPHFSQVNISRWLNFGGTGKQESSMPSMEVAITLADFFGVDVGYLLGETEYKTFKAEEAVKYLGLSESAVEHIRLATRWETAFGAVQMLPEEAGESISALMSTKGFFPLIRALKEMDDVYNGPDIQKKLFDGLEKKYGAEILAQAMDLELNPEEHEEVEIDEKVLEAYADFQEALDQSYAADMDRQISVEAKRYKLSQAFSAIIEELYPE